MILWEQASKQVNRMSDLSGFPKGREGKIELIAAMQSASSEEAAVDATTTWIRENAHAAKPADLYRALMPAVPEWKSEYERTTVDLTESGVLYSVWTDRDVAIHQQLAENGATKHAREYAKGMLKGWNRWCEQRSDTWNVPTYDPDRYEDQKRRTPGQPWCDSCSNSGWLYLGLFEVCRCSCIYLAGDDSRSKASKA